MLKIFNFLIKFMVKMMSKQITSIFFRDIWQVTYKYEYKAKRIKITYVQKDQNNLCTFNFPKNQKLKKIKFLK